MGYDFILARMRQLSARHPARIPDATGAAVMPIGEPSPLHELLRHSALIEPGALAFRTDASVQWTTPDGGTLDIAPSGQAIRLDTHADRDHVATLFDVVRELWPETALMDFQTGLLHDPASFRTFARRTRAQAPDGCVRESAAGHFGDAAD